jgi:hypothetical protein
LPIDGGAIGFSSATGMQREASNFRIDSARPVFVACKYVEVCEMFACCEGLLAVPFGGQAVDEDLHVRDPLELRV